VDDELRAWIETTTGGRVVHVERPPGGGSRELYLVDVDRDGCIVPLVLRCEAGGSFTGTDISPAKEALVYRALEHTDVPVPRVIALAPNDAALLMERVPGTADLSTLDADARAATMRSFVDALSALHNLDVDELELPGLARPRTPEEHARLDLDTWARLADGGVPDLDPLVRYSGAWLRANAPTTVSRTVLVQGDTGPGNFLFDDARVTGIVDWEFAHLGDPMDDWAWLDMRATGCDLSELQERYRAATRIPIEEHRIRFYRAAVDYRCAVTTSLAVSRGGGARGFAPYLLVTERYITGLAARMSQLLGVAESPDLPDLGPTPRTAYFDTLLDGIRTAVRALDDSELREATRNLQILVHFLRAYDQVGDGITARDRADRIETLGSDALDDGRFRQMVENAGAEGDEAMFGYLLRRTARERLLWASLLERPRR
jgi:aminoglycoside phosphotransferase (APT) family kinase protein